MDQNKRVALLTAIDLGNLTRAAEQLGYTQSGLSYVIKALEAELGFPLLVRSRAGVRPTDECQRILPLLRELDRKSRQLEQEAADIRGLAVGNVFIATFPSISRFWLPQILRDFAQLYPGITVSIRESGHSSCSSWPLSRHHRLHPGERPGGTGRVAAGGRHRPGFLQLSRLPLPLDPLFGG